MEHNNTIEKVTLIQTFRLPVYTNAKKEQEQPRDQTSVHRILLRRAATLFEARLLVKSRARLIVPGYSRLAAFGAFNDARKISRLGQIGIDFEISVP
jgi:hypothetical protein